MTEENIRLRDTLKAAESVIVSALRSQPEGDAECKSHLEKALEDVYSKVSFLGKGEVGSISFQAVKLREALEKSRAFIVKLAAAWAECEGVECGEDEILPTIDAALAASARNYDVGTLDEQIDRLLAFCGRKGKCTRCEHQKIGTLLRECTLKWAHAPYESEATDGSK